MKHSQYNEITNRVREALVENKSVESVNILDTGFVNIKLSDYFLKTALVNRVRNFSFLESEDKETVLLDFGGANIGKSLHVGHIRTLNIGRSLTNIYKVAGYKTITDIHFGDWGMPLALIICYIEEENLDINNITYEDLENIYPSASIQAKDSESFYLKALEISKEMNLGNKKRLSQWKIIYELSTSSVKYLLKKLDFKFDYYLGESDVVDILPNFIDNLKEKNLVKIDDGALIANDNQEPPALITKSDGSYMYLTTDLGTVIFREGKFKADKYIYVVDQRQKQHFDQLFKLIHFFNLSNSIFSHVAFGTVNDKVGKPLKTRDGQNYKLEDLFNDILNRLSINNSDKESAATLAKSVLTYSDLVTKRTSNYKFDLDKFINITGKSAIFLQYSQVRAKKLLDQNKSKTKLHKFNVSDRSLALEILKFNNYFNTALYSNEPHHIAEYAYNLCHEFNKFYTENKIFSDDVSKEDSLHRLFLVEIYYETILKVFECLGMTPVEKM